MSRFAELSRGHIAAADLLNDLHANGVEHEVGDRTLCNHGFTPNRYHYDNVLIDVPPIEAEESAMTQTTYGMAGVDVRFPGWESMMVGRSFLHVPLAAIRSARVEPGWTSEVLGIRSGFVMSGYRKLGTFTHPSGVRRLVAMKRGMPLLRLHTVRDETGFDEILLSTDDAENIAHNIQEGLAR